MQHLISCTSQSKVWSFGSSQSKCVQLGTICFLKISLSPAAQTSPSSTNAKTAILMLNMGGPRNLPEVEPFLRRLFLDRDIINLPMQKYKYLPIWPSNNPKSNRHCLFFYLVISGLGLRNDEHQKWLPNTRK